MTRTRRIQLAIGAFAALYCAVYAMLRSGHVILHFSNADHWHPEKRSAGHVVNTASDRSLADRIVRALFRPAMLAEQQFRNSRG